MQSPPMIKFGNLPGTRNKPPTDRSAHGRMQAELRISRGVPGRNPKLANFSPKRTKLIARPSTPAKITRAATPPRGPFSVGTDPPEEVRRYKAEANITSRRTYSPALTVEFIPRDQSHFVTEVTYTMSSETAGEENPSPSDLAF